MADLQDAGSAGKGQESVAAFKESKKRRGTFAPRRFLAKQIYCLRLHTLFLVYRNFANFGEGRGGHAGAFNAETHPSRRLPRRR